MPAVKGTPYIPKSLWMPGPHVYRVQVNQLRPMKMRAKHGEFYDGIWNKETREIDLNSRLSHKRKWYVFAGAYQHAVESWYEWLVDTGTAVARQ